MATGSALAPHVSVSNSEEEVVDKGEDEDDAVDMTLDLFILCSYFAIFEKGTTKAPLNPDVVCPPLRAS